MRNPAAKEFRTCAGGAQGPASPEALFARLDELGIRTTTFEHPPAFTVEESKALRGQIAGAHTKNLLLADKSGYLVLVVALESTVVDLKRLHQKLGCGRLSFAKAEVMVETLGVSPGSVTPFAIINDGKGAVRLVLDAKLTDHEILNFHPLRNTATTSLSRKDFLAFLRSCGREPEIVDLAS